MIDEFKIGRRSKTWVGLVYIKDIHNEDKRKELGDKLKKIDIDALITINDILPYFLPNALAIDLPKIIRWRVYHCY